MRTTSGLATVLFGKSMRAILAQLYGRPDRRFYVREIARGAGTPPARCSVTCWLSRAPALSSATRTGGRSTTRRTRTAHLGELKGIVAKTFGVADLVREALRRHEKQIRAAFIYGSVAKGSEAPGSDLDLFVVGDLPPSAAAVDLDRIMLDLRRRVSLTSYSVEEFVRLRAEENSFVTRVLEGPFICRSATRPPSMPSDRARLVQNLARARQLHAEAPDEREIAKLLAAARRSLDDARTGSLSAAAASPSPTTAAIRWRWRRCASRLSARRSGSSAGSFPGARGYGRRVGAASARSRPAP